MELQQLIEKWEKEIAKVNITDEDESGKWYENEWSHGRYGAISEFLADVKQLNLPPVSNNEVAVCSPCDDIKCTSRYSLFCKTKCEDRIKQTDC